MSSTPFADLFVGRGEEVLKAELRRLRLLETDCLQRQEQANLKLEEERRKSESLLKQRLAEVELMEKSISYFQFKTTLSSFIDAKLLREAESALLCHQVLEAFVDFPESPARISELLEEDDEDGKVSSVLLLLCTNLQTARSASRDEIAETSKQLKLWIETRLGVRMTQFEIARRSQHIPLMQSHANYLTKHGGGEMFCSFLADLALRPLLFQHQVCPNVAMLDFVFDQTTLQIAQIKQQVFANLHLEDEFLPVFRSGLYSALFPAGTRLGLQTLLKDWLHAVESPALKLDLLVQCKRRIVTLVEKDISSAFSLFPLNRLFPAKDYYMLELSQLAPDSPSVRAEEGETIGQFIQTRAEPFANELFARLALATSRAEAYLSTSEFQTSCFETFSSFACIKLVHELCLPVLAWAGDNLEDDDDEDEQSVFLHTVVPFVRSCKERLLGFFSLQINSKLLVVGKVKLLDDEVNRLFKRQVDGVFDGGEFRDLVKSIGPHATRLRGFGDGVLVNLLQRFRDAVLMECLERRQVGTLERGEALAIELATIAQGLDVSFQCHSALAQQCAKQVVAEIKQLGNVFALPKAALDLNALPLVKRIPQVVQFVERRRY